MKRFLRHLAWSKDVLILAAMLWLIHSRRSFVQPEQIQAMIQGFGILAPLAFVAACALAIAAFVPPVLPVGVGAIAFGKTLGAAYALAGMTLGACGAFLLGRYSALNPAHGLRRSRLRKIDEWMQKCSDIPCMFSLRLIVFGNPTFNYLSAAMRIRLRDYALGTFLGLIPRTFLISYFFDLFLKVESLQDALAHPLVFMFPMLPIVGAGLLVVLTRGARTEAA